MKTEIFVGNNAVNLDCPRGFYWAERATFDAITWRDAEKRMAEIWDGYEEDPERKLYFDSLDKEVYRVVIRIMAAEFTGMVK